MLGLVAGPAAGDYFISVRDNEGVELGGVSLLDGDLARYDPLGELASIYLAESTLTGGSVDINAAHVRADGSIVLSTLFSASIGGLSFGDGDLVDYDPSTGRASVLLPEAAWGDLTSATDVNAVYVHDDGKIVLSHNNAQDELGGLVFTNGDIVEYDPRSGLSVLLVSERALFDDGNGNIDALHVLDDGSYVLSFSDDETISGSSFADGDLVRYDATTGVSSLFASDAIFGSKGLANDINAFSIASVPEPATLVLLGLAGLTGRGRGRREHSG